VADLKSEAEREDLRGESFPPALYKFLLGLYLLERMLVLAQQPGALAGSDLHSPATSALGSLVSAHDAFDFLESEEERLTGVTEPEDTPPSYRSELDTVLEDLDALSTVRSPHGTGGVYFLEDRSHRSKVVFKPFEEENETTDGNGFRKEYAAFLLDNGLAGVPETKISHVHMKDKGLQLGSVQAYVSESEDAEDFGSGLFAVEDIHRIGVLDIRILNCDRHSGNLMRNKRTGKLVPIDHGSSFPSAFSDKLGEVSFEWLQYPQAKVPFSPEVLQAIADIDIEEDASKIREAGLNEGIVLSTWMSTTLLKLCAKENKTLFDIGTLMQRKGDRREPSALEAIFREALEAAIEEEANFFEEFVSLAQRLAQRHTV